MSMAPIAGEMKALTGLRGVLMAGVVIVHLDPVFRLLLPGWDRFDAAVRHGPVIAEYFFLLSGFVLFQASRSLPASFTPAAHARFLWSRFARLWPVHVATAAAVAGVVTAARGLGAELPGEFPLRDVPFQLTMTHTWWRAPGDDWNDISWYVSSLWFAYVVLLPPAAAALARRWPWPVYALACAALPLLWLQVAWSGMSREHFPIVRVTCAFLGGCALHGVVRATPGATEFLRRRASWIALAIVLLVATYVKFSWHALLLLAPPLVAGLTAERSAVARLFASRPFTRFGRLSFSLYLSHVAAWRTMEAVLPAERFAGAPLAVRLAVLAAYGAAILALALAVERCVEGPGRDALVRLGERGWPARPAGRRDA